MYQKSSSESVPIEKTKRAYKRKAAVPVSTEAVTSVGQTASDSSSSSSSSVIAPPPVERVKRSYRRKVNAQVTAQATMPVTV